MRRNQEEKRLQRNTKARKRYAELPKEKKATLLRKMRENYAEKKMLQSEQERVVLLEKRRENYAKNKMLLGNLKRLAEFSCHEVQSDEIKCISEKKKKTNADHEKKETYSNATFDKGKTQMSFYNSFDMGSSSSSTETNALRNQLFPFSDGGLQQIHVTTITSAQAENVEKGENINAYEYVDPKFLSNIKKRIRLNRGSSEKMKEYHNKSANHLKTSSLEAMERAVEIQGNLFSSYTNFFKFILKCHSSKSFKMALLLSLQRGTSQ